MASTSVIYLVLMLSLINSMSISMARLIDSNAGLAARLHLDGSSNCWESLVELQACSGEVILFFLNGETHLGPGCCKAIRTIENQCWPAMLGMLGFTAEEGDILEGYCDAEANFAAPPPPN